MVEECLLGNSIFPEVASSLSTQGGVCERREHAGVWGGRKDASPESELCPRTPVPPSLAFTFLCPLVPLQLAP